MAWLDDNPPRIRQFRCPRRRPLSGVIDIHTAESFPDETGPDTGAENVARFIRDRTNFGSYHDLCDSDSIVHLVRDSCESFSVGTLSLNHHGYAISAATQAHKWNQLSNDWVDATVRNMARAAARFVKRNRLTVPALWLTADQARREVPGFIRHSTADPDRRRDPGTSFPSNTFFAYYLEELGDDDMQEADFDRIDKMFERRLSLKRGKYGFGSETPISIRSTGAWKYSWGAYLHAKRTEAKVDTIVEAVKDIPGIDVEALENRLVAAVEGAEVEINNEAIAEAVANEQAERMQE